MSTARWGVAVVALGALAFGCSGTSASGTSIDGSDARDATTVDGRADDATDAGDVPATTPDAPSPTDATPPDVAPEAAAPDAPSDANTTDTRDAEAADVPLAAGDARDAATMADGAASGDAATPGDAAPGDAAGSDAAPGLGSNWAQWPMPNIASDVANGAPHPEMLVDNGDDTVSDHVTGLMWQRTATITMYTRAQAAARCQKTRLGGNADWRVPSAIELSSITDYDHINPSVDPSAFPDTPLNMNDASHPQGYTATTTIVGANGWMVDFTSGRATLYSFGDSPFFLRCVRGPSAPATDTSAGRYDLSTAGVALDAKTGLTWQRVPTSTRTKLADAKTFCATGGGLPGTGWRLPTVKELMTLIDYEKTSGWLLDETVFTIPTNVGDPYGVFWTATAVVGKPEYSQFTLGAWTVYFSNGNNYYVDATTDSSLTRCVR